MIHHSSDKVQRIKARGARPNALSHQIDSMLSITTSEGKIVSGGDHRGNRPTQGGRVMTHYNSSLICGSVSRGSYPLLVS